MLAAGNIMYLIYYLFGKLLRGRKQAAADKKGILKNLSGRTDSALPCKTMRRLRLVQGLLFCRPVLLFRLTTCILIYNSDYIT